LAPKKNYSVEELLFSIGMDLELSYGWSLADGEVRRSISFYLSSSWTELQMVKEY